MRKLFKKNPTARYEVGEFIFSFYSHPKYVKENYLKITTTSGIFELKVMGYTYGYLSESARQGKTDELHSFAMMMLIVSGSVYKDEALAKDLIEAVERWHQRTLDEGAELASGVTESEEAANQALMDEVAAYADANEAQREEMRKESREAIEEVLSEDV